MKPGRLALLLLSSGAVVHLGTGYVAMRWFSNPARAWEHLQYIARALDATLLYGVIYALAAALFQPALGRWWLGVVCVSGAFAQSMMAICGIGYWTLGGDGNAVVGLCSAVQGWGPIALLFAALILAGVAWGLGRG